MQGEAKELWRRLPAFSRTLVCVATAALAASAGMSGGVPRVIVAAGPSLTGGGKAVCWLIVAAAALAAAQQCSKAPAIAVAVAWAAASGFAAASLLGSRVDAVSVVPVLQCLMVATTLGAMITLPGESRRLLPRASSICVSAGLLTFGFIHLTRSSDISALLAADIPLRTMLPMLSGGLMFVCGAGVAWPSTRRISAGLAAILFLSWLPIVHLPRIAARPASPFEWQFASMALALAGTLLAQAAGAGTKPDRRPGARRRRIGLTEEG